MTSKNKQQRNAIVQKTTESSDKIVPSPKKDDYVLLLEHLPPLPLVFVILFCSGAMWVFGLRDALATGKNILGEMDYAYLEFTKSLKWFDNSKGWRSTQGGLSAIRQITTDDNDMGGLFVRKLLGATAMGVHIHKLLPILFHPKGCIWESGHFRPLLTTAIISNIAIATLYGIYLEDFSTANAEGLPKLFIMILGFETIVLIYYLLGMKKITRGPAVVMPEGKTPTSIVSRILARTVAVVTGITAMIAGRDLFFPGYIFKFFPRDEVYLEWTGAFLHSPPEGSPEAADQGMDAAFYIADKFLSQMLALNILILALYKFVSAFLVKYGADGSGIHKTKIIWQGSFAGMGMIFLIFRLFAPAAKSASWDPRWHLMSMGYELIIFFLYVFY
mmetsp:Transcript_23672/g.34961  ORF Transcript_23672/g.34961 Transcript_23672/m.34961 type:complete len:388 (+) Transcript_23672:106-1269(+)|eukprot:CAMPEP_0194208212 /NCGR_PEP_ID=MMETSP0156-20130528/6718_1 /TAXON_ID=33649 /ORGANISM="Thalassionema nitzschioides, Strain L26-B" /LENGTH=387 /DNA_ID=CAMNT_0038935129 /DNA_START=45 /DNA_END=1208 /DNA_ORIENTATION=-